MDDNILISYELINDLNWQKGHSRYLGVLKLDMNKAYDRVSWLFILKILTAYGFPAQWVTLIHQYISTDSYRVMINGKVTEAFKP